MLFTTVRFTTPEVTERFTRQSLGEVLPAVPPSSRDDVSGLTVRP